MKICLVHNAYGKFSGEEAVVRDIRALLEKHDHNVVSFERSSEEISQMYFGSARALLSGIYNPASRHSFRQLLLEESPDILHIHNLYPMISPSILPVATMFGIPVVMTVHNYRLVCPNGLHYSKGEICERCATGSEYWCVLNNCEGSAAKSIGYALRNWWARLKGYYQDNVCIFACLTQFQRDRLIKAGFSQDKVVVIPNMVKAVEPMAIDSEGEYVGYAGRISREKGIDVLVNVSRQCKDIPFRAIGDYSRMPRLHEDVPNNFSLMGHCDGDKLTAFYSNARIIVLPSVCWETFGLVIVEAMSHGKPVVACNIGGLPYIVEHGVTGLLVEPGNETDLEEKIRYLWERPDLCKKMGEAGRAKALSDYSQDKYYVRLMSVYKRAISECKKK